MIISKLTYITILIKSLDPWMQFKITCENLIKWFNYVESAREKREKSLVVH